MKRGCLALILAIFLIIALPFSLGQNQSTGEKIDGAKDKIGSSFDTFDSIRSGKTGLNDFENSWTSSFSNTTLGSTIISAGPAISRIFGIEFSISRLFLLTLFLWVALLVLIYRLLSLPSILIKLPRLVISLMLIVLASWAGVTKAISLSIMAIINSIESGFLKLMAFLALLALLAIVIVYSRLIESFALGHKRESRIKKAEKKAEMAERAATASKESEEDEIEEEVREEFQDIGEDEK